jgi:hypothetical protein
MKRSEVVDLEQQHHLIDAERQREEGDAERQRKEVYTKRQRDLIRARVKEYYELHHYAARRMTWAGFCDEVFDNTQVHVRSDVLRQWVVGFVAKNRKQPLRPRPEELEAIAKLLMAPDIGMLLPEELVGPEPPHRFLRSFLELLRVDPNRPVPPPPQTLSSGVYEACHQVEDPDQIEEIWIKTSLTLEVDRNSRYVHATETWEIHFHGTGEPPLPGGGRPSEGWGVVTPEGSLFLVMKTQPNAHNFYYLPVEENSRYLALLRHEPPIRRRDAPQNRTFEELNDAMKGRTRLLNFKRVAKSDVGE